MEVWWLMTNNTINPHYIHKKEGIILEPKVRYGRHLSPTLVVH